MPKDLVVTPLASPDLGAEKVSSDQGDTKILEDNPEAYVHNIFFYESQHKVVPSCRVPTTDDYASLA